MANIYGFNSKEIAEELKRQGEEGLEVDPSNMDATGNETIIIKCGEAVTPRAGLAVSGPFTGDVVYFGSGGLSLADQLDDVEFYNLTDASYEQLDVVTLTRWRELWVIVGGGGGGGSANYLCKAPVGGVPARTGNDASQTDCDTYEINSQSGAISATGSTLNIYNVWSQGIAPNAYFTVKQIDGVYVPDAEDCTGN